MKDSSPTASPSKSELPVSPLAVSFPSIGAIDGVTLATARAGLSRRVRDDVLLMRFDEGASWAGVFTQHKVGSAPVDWCLEALRRSGGTGLRALVVNAGCANSFTGAAGRSAVEAVTGATAAALACAPQDVLVASTGVIGVPLDAGLIVLVLEALIAGLATEGWAAAARAIMTTDTFAKGALRTCTIDGRTVKVAGIAKGSGMIAPDMATMLSFVATDAAVGPAALQTILSDATTRTWNAVTVDGDRSTNDTCLLIATGVGDDAANDAADPRLADFARAVEAVLLDLAQQLVRDGEGARKFVTVRVTGAVSQASAARIARTICESPLVKTALAGEDANWGRVAAAAGRADEPLDRDRLSIRFGALWAARDGAVSPDYDEAAMSAYMTNAELEIVVDAGVGTAAAVMWTCDLTHGYITINGDYRS